MRTRRMRLNEGLQLKYKSLDFKMTENRDTMVFTMKSGPLKAVITLTDDMDNYDQTIDVDIGNLADWVGTRYLSDLMSLLDASFYDDVFDSNAFLSEIGYN